MLTRHYFAADGPTYADTGDKLFWVQGCGSGLQERQCTAQISLFTN